MDRQPVKTGDLAQMYADMERGVFDFTVDGKCSGCGACCTNFLPMSGKEVKIIRRYIEKHGITEQTHRYPTAEAQVDFTCPFRSETEKKCLIYEVRPLICRDFQCDKPRKKILADKQFYHDRYNVVDCRSEFFGRESTFWKALGVTV